MAGRASKSVARRRAHYERLINAARTPKSRLWAWCSVFTAVAFHADRIDEAITYIQGWVNAQEKREKEATS